MASKAIPSETQRAKLERKERAILEAARTIFVNHGFDGARMQEIARRAGIGEGTIYSYYDSKAELMLAVLQQFWDGLTLEAEDVMAAEQALRRNNSEVSVSRDHLRHYVAVFDRLFLRGQDRGELRADAVLWQARDIFYGSLEYSARSIEMTMEADRSTRDQQPVVDDMVALFRAHYGAHPESEAADGTPLAALSRQIEQLTEKVDTLASRLS